LDPGAIPFFFFSSDPAFLPRKAIFAFFPRYNAGMSPGGPIPLSSFSDRYTFSFSLSYTINREALFPPLSKRKHITLFPRRGGERPFFLFSFFAHAFSLLLVTRS